MVCFFYKQKTAYELRISDWSSDVCSSDLSPLPRAPPAVRSRGGLGRLCCRLVVVRRSGSIRPGVRVGMTAPGGDPRRAGVLRHPAGDDVADPLADVHGVVADPLVVATDQAELHDHLDVDLVGIQLHDRLDVLPVALVESSEEQPT